MKVIQKREEHGYRSPSPLSSVFKKTAEEKKRKKRKEGGREKKKRKENEKEEKKKKEETSSILFLFPPILNQNVTPGLFLTLTSFSSPDSYLIQTFVLTGNGGKTTWK